MEFFDIIEISNLEYVTCGFINDKSQGTGKGVLTRLSCNGDVVWENSFRIKNIVTNFQTVNRTITGYLVGGQIGNTVTSIKECFFANLDTSGNLKNYKILNTDRNEYFGDLKIINNNKYVISMSRDSGIVALKGKVIITDCSGYILTERIFPTTDFIEFRSILALTNGDIIFSGISGFNIPGADEVGYAVRTDSNLNYKTSRIVNHTTEVMTDFKLYQNYPNPFNPVTTINYEFKKRTRYDINLYDILGKKIAILISEEKIAGKYKLQLNTRDYNLSSGIYFVDLLTSFGGRKKIKVVLLK